MKKFLGLFITLAWSVSAFAQTPKEILTRMADEWEKHEKDGLVMTADTKIPIVGTVSMKQYSLGKKTRSEANLMDVQVIIWDDGVTEWTYTGNDNKLTIKNSAIGHSSEDSNAELFSDVTEGYDISIKKETADSWLLLCKKSKTNTDKDAPKEVEITVAKDSFYPISLRTKIAGVSLVLHDISFGVKEELVTFRIEDYPGAVIEDERKR